MRKIIAYHLFIEMGTHREVIRTDKQSFEEWIKEISKEFKIHEEIETIGTTKHKILYITNYWNEPQNIGAIWTIHNN